MNRLFESQKADGIGDRRTVLAGAMGGLFLGEAKFVGQTLERAGLLDGLRSSRWRFSTSVISSAISSRTSRTTTGTRLYSSPLRGSPTAFAGDELVAFTNPSHHKRLHDAAGADGPSELLQRLFSEASAGLIRARVDLVDIGI